MKIFSFKNLILILLCLISFIFTGDANPHQILELDQTNYKEVIESSDSILILFYESGCQKCKNFEKSINEAIQRIIGESLSSDQNEAHNANQILNKTKFAKVDGFKYREIVEEYEVDNFPSVRFIRPKFNIKNELTQFINTNTFSAQHIINFLKMRLIKKWNEVESVDQLKEYIKDNNLNLLVCDHNESSTYNITNYIENIIVYYDDINLIFVSNLKTEEESSHQILLQYLKCSEENPQIILFKNFDEKELRFYELYKRTDINEKVNEKDIDDFLDTYSVPLVSDFTTENLQMVIQRGIPTVIFIYKDNLPLDTYGVFYNQSKKHRRDILFLKLKSSEEHASAIMEMMNIKEKNLPSVIALQNTEEELIKFKLGDDVKLSNEIVGTFIEKFSKKELKNYILSESQNYENPFYTENEGNVYKVVGENFDEIVNNKGRCFLLYPYVGTVLPDVMVSLEKISRKLLEIDEDDKIKLGLIDLQLNEVGSIEDPLILHLFDKNNKMKQFQGNISVKKIINFLVDNDCYDKNVTITYHEEDEDEINLEDPFEGYANYKNEGDLQEQIDHVNNGTNNQTQTDSTIITDGIPLEKSDL